jgi:predicted pyridoxine 5'-phosphate oxidase superfamily flavin-nucleotide-binding protein
MQSDRHVVKLSGSGEAIPAAGEAIMNNGERELQDRLGTRERADAFHARQMLSHLNEAMRHFIGRQEMMFLATADAGGGCDNTFRAGPPGFVRVLDEHHLSWPELRGNGVMASLGNITENAQVGLLFLDFGETIGLHVNGTAEIVEDPDDQAGTPPGQRARLWVVTRVQEAYIHCTKHIPRMAKIPRQRGDSEQPRKSQYFRPAPPRSGVVPPRSGVAPPCSGVAPPCSGVITPS